MNVELRAITGDALQSWLIPLAQLRIEIFREFPYLYDGDLEYEKNYLRAFSASQRAIISGAFDGDVLVGAATGAPLEDQAPEITGPFRQRDLDLGRYFYFGESVLRRAYRGQGIGVHFFEQREMHARAVDAEYALFCSVVRKPDHPLRPLDYSSLDSFWHHRGYSQMEGMTCDMSWKEVGTHAKSVHQMQFWYRKLKA